MARTVDSVFCYSYLWNWTASRRHLTIAQRTISIHLAKINFWNNQNL